MTLTQLLRLAAKLFALVRTQRTKNNPNPTPTNLPEHGSLAQAYTTEPLSHPHQPEIPASSRPHSWIGVSLDKDMHDALQTLARDKNLTIEELIHHAISEFFKSRHPTKPA